MINQFTKVHFNCIYISIKRFILIREHIKQERRKNKNINPSIMRPFKKNIYKELG